MQWDSDDSAETVVFRRAAAVDQPLDSSPQSPPLVISHFGRESNSSGCSGWLEKRYFGR